MFRWWVCGSSFLSFSSENINDRAYYIVHICVYMCIYIYTHIHMSNLYANILLCVLISCCLYQTFHNYKMEKVY